MTTRELIDYLQTLDPTGDFRVFIRGYEFGFHDANIDSVGCQRIKLWFHGINPRWGGPHEITSAPVDDTASIVNAICFG